MAGTNRTVGGIFNGVDDPQQAVALGSVKDTCLLSQAEDRQSGIGLVADTTGRGSISFCLPIFWMIWLISSLELSIMA